MYPLPAKTIASALLLAVFLCAAQYAAGATPHPGSQPASKAVGLSRFPFDTEKGEPAVPKGLEGRPQRPGRPGYVIVKFTGKDNAGARKRLSGKGIKFFGYVPVDSFLAKVPYGRRGTVESDPYVYSVYDYRPAYRLDGPLVDQAARGVAGTRKLVVQVFDDETLGPVVSAVEALGGTVDVLSDSPGPNGKMLRVALDASALATLASVDGVQWVEEETAPVLHNDAAVPVMNADYAFSQPVPLTGTGQVAAVCDTGLDTGNTSTVHMDFSGNTSDGLPKIKQAFAYGRANDWSDPHGHGTHTAGSLAGFGSQSGQLVPGLLLRGTAFDARLVFQSIAVNAAGSLSLPNLNTTVFPDAYGAGARVHSNSWGYSGTAGSYTYSSVLADTYTWNHKDFTVLFSAGNDGADSSPADGVIDYGSVGSPSTAKNVITVGASENNRPGITTKWGTAVPGAYQPPILNDKMADNTSGMAAFSGRGPCLDGRIKPDVVAPGTYVLSARSSVSANSVTLASKWGYSGSLDPYYSFKTGTSMSCPLTAGAAVLVREYVVTRGIASPSSALIKGLIIAGAADMTPGQYTGAEQDVTARPDNNQGWGRVDVKGSLYPVAPKRLAYGDYTPGLTTGGSKAYVYSVPDTTVDVRVNLVWTDYPGTSGVSPNIVNDLDLTVTGPDGSVYHGNAYAGSASVAGAAAYDRLNNVEGVTIPAASLIPGTLTVSVSGYNVPQGPQPFALVVSGGFSAPPAVTGILPASGMNNVPTPVTLSGSGFVAGASVYVGGTACEAGSVSGTSIQATVPAGLAAGVKYVSVVNPDMQSGTLSGGFTVDQDTTVPPVPQGLAASPGDTTINLRWTPVFYTDLSGYRVYFGSYSTTVGAVDTHRLTGLTNGVAYDVYIRSLDAAGNVSGPSSTVTATPSAPSTELPHYSWDGSPRWGCTSCHVQPSGGGLLPAGFSYSDDASLCMSCHNAASSGHGRTVDQARSHSVFVDVTSGGGMMPVFGGVTSGEYSDTMYTHLKGGRQVVCTTCHNIMQKPHDTGRAWEYTQALGDRVYKAAKGGWWDQGHADVRVYKDTTLWTPGYSKDREARRLSPDGYSYDAAAGTVTLSTPATGYVYLSLDDMYLRAPGTDSTACADCHQTATHRTLNCLTCHTAHNTANLSLVRESVRIPDGTLSEVVFTSATGAHSFADGDAARDGICEVCHTQTLYYRRDGSVLDNHTGTGVDYSGQDCTVCHTHASGFAR